MKFIVEDSGAIHTEFDFGKLVISGNSEIGFRPFQLLVSSIVGCSGSVFKKVLAKKRISFETMEIEANVERNEKEANRVTKITVHYMIKGENLNLDQLHKALMISMKNCPIVQSVKDSIEIIETIEIKN